MTTTDYTPGGLPPFPPETVGEWAVEWIRSDFRLTFPRASTGLAISATHGGLRRRNSVRIPWADDDTPPTAERLEQGRKLLLDWLLDWLEAAQPDQP